MNHERLTSGRHRDAWSTNKQQVRALCCEWRIYHLVNFHNAWGHLKKYKFNGVFQTQSNHRSSGVSPLANFSGTKWRKSKRPSLAVCSRNVLHPAVFHNRHACTYMHTLCTRYCGLAPIGGDAMSLSCTSVFSLSVRAQWSAVWLSTTCHSYRAVVVRRVTATTPTWAVLTPLRSYISMCLKQLLIYYHFIRLSMIFINKKMQKGCCFQSIIA